MKNPCLAAVLVAASLPGQAAAQGWNPSSQPPTVVLPERVTPRAPDVWTNDAVNLAVTDGNDGPLAGFVPFDPEPDPDDQPRPATPAPSPSAPSSRKAPEYAPGQMISGIAAAIDGHTLTVVGHALRLDGVDAPGLRQTCGTADGTTWRCGEAALRTLSSMVHGEMVRCTVATSLVSGAAAICSVQGIADVGREMVRRGFAVPNGHDFGKYVADSAQAQSVRAGIWAGNFQAPWTWRAENGGR